LEDSTGQTSLLAIDRAQALVAVVAVVRRMSAVTMRASNSGWWTVGMVEMAWTVRTAGIVGIGKSRWSGG